MHPCPILRDVQPGVALLDHTIIQCLRFGGRAMLSSTAIALSYIFSDVQEFQCLHNLINTCYFPFFHGLCSACELAIHIVFETCFFLLIICHKQHPIFIDFPLQPLWIAFLKPLCYSVVCMHICSFKTNPVLLHV